MRLPPGTILQNRYRIIRIIGQGGFSTVYLVDDIRLSGRQVAIKEFNSALLPQASHAWAKTAFQQEVQVLAKLQHPGIALVSDLFTANQLEYLVMDYIDGKTLKQALQHQPNQGFPESQVLEWARQLSSVLAYLHNHNPPIIFRDLKPSNIIVQPNGQLKLIDFGIIRYFKPGKTSDTQLVGTPGYAAPEQYGHGQTDARSDIYSLGVVLHQLLTNHNPALTPMNLPPIHTLNPTVSPYIIAAIEQALNINPDFRFPSIRSFAAALGITPSGQLVTPPPIRLQAPTRVPSSQSRQPFPTSPTSPPRRRWPVALALIAAIAIGGYAFWSILDGNVLGGATALALLVLVFMLMRTRLGPLKVKIEASGQKIGQPEDSRGGKQQSQRPIDDNPYKTRQLSPDTLRAQEGPKIRVKDFGDIIEPLIAHHLGRIEAKFSTKGATRLFLTGFGSFGGTSLVRATTARLLEAVKNNQGEQVFVIRFDTSRRHHSGEYQLFVNENLVGTLKEPVDQGVLLAKINDALGKAAKSDNPHASNTLVQADFFAGMTRLFAQDVTASQAIVDLVSQVLKLLESTHDDTVMHKALNDLLAGSTQRRQMVLIIDHLEREEAMRRLLACPLCHQFSHPGLSLVVVARHQAFMRWDERLCEQIREQRSLEYYYIRRLWLEDFNVRKMLSHFMDFDVSTLNEQEQQHFDKLLAHLTYQARGSVAIVIRELRKGPYLSKEDGIMAIDLDAILRSGRESIEHNVRVQQLLDQNWDKILGPGMAHVEMADQARVGVYHVIEWIRHHPIFKINTLVAAVRTRKIMISDQEPILAKVLIGLLVVLERESYLQYQPQAESYHLTWQKKKSQFSFMYVWSISKRIRQQVVQALEEELSPSGNDKDLPDNNEEETDFPGNDEEEEDEDFRSELGIALLADGADGAAHEVVSLATQIAFEVVEAGHSLVMTDRGGIEGVVREKLAPYWSLYVEDFPRKREHPYEIVSQASNLKLKIELLKKADVIVLVQAHGASDSAFVRDVKKMAKRAGVPIIEPLADIEPAEPFFVPEVARRVVEWASENSF